MIVAVEEKYRGDLPVVRELADVVVFPKNQVRLWGKLSTIAPVMGRRQILTADSADNSNRDVVEVLIDCLGEQAGEHPDRIAGFGAVFRVAVLRRGYCSPRRSTS